MMHSPLFQISPLFSTNFQTLRKILKNLSFPENVFYFHSPKFLKTFSNFEISPYFPCFSTFSPLIRKNYYFPLLRKISFLFSKNSPAFYILYVYFVSPLL